MINLKKYITSIIYKAKTKAPVDTDFWGDLRLIDIEESDNCVRYCFTIYEPIN